MAIAFDAASKIVTSGTSATVSHTCTGTNLILFSLVKAYLQGDIVTGVTYNSSAMTQIGKVSQPGPAYYYLYYKVNPSTGANNIVASASSSLTEFDVCSMSYTGAAQSGVPDAFNTGGNTPTSLTVSVTTTANNCWLVGGGGSDDGSTISAGANTTGRTTGGFNGVNAFDSNAAKTPAGSYGLTFSATGGMTAIIASFAPYTNSVRLLASTGVGT